MIRAITSIVLLRGCSILGSIDKAIKDSLIVLLLVEAGVDRFRVRHVGR